jgi:hypothetical protein
MGKGHFGSGVFALALALALPACSTPLPAAANGQQCLLDDDCVCGGEAGCFVCLNHVCTADLSSIVSFEDAGNGSSVRSPTTPVPSDAAMEDVPTSPPPTMDATDGNATVPAPVMEAGAPDAQTQPQADSAVVPAESSIPADDGASMQDSAPSDE